MLKLRESFGVKLISRDALLSIRAERLPGSRFRVSVYDPVVSTRPEASLDDQAVDLTVQVSRYFEDWTREYPEQWVCLKRRWPKAHKL